MANKATIGEWLVKNIDKYNIRFTELEWPQKYGFPFSDFACDLNLEGQIFSGRGSSLDKDEAIIKAFVEAVERLHIKESGLQSSNGVASHLTIEMAKENALTELVERDSFLCHFLTSTAFFEIPTPDLPDTILTWIEKFRTHGVDVILKKMTSPSNFTCIIACAFGSLAVSPFGLIVATSCNQNHERALVKSFMEVSRAISHRLETRSPHPISISDFRKLTKISLADHYRLSLGLEYAQSFKEKYLTNEEPAFGACFDVSSVTFSKVTDKQETLTGLPLVTFKASAEMAQEMFWGSATNEKLNFKRLTQFKRKPFNLEDINILPHPFR